MKQQLFLSFFSILIGFFSHTSCMEKDLTGKEYLSFIFMKNPSRTIRWAKQDLSNDFLKKENKENLVTLNELFATHDLAPNRNNEILFHWIQKTLTPEQKKVPILSVYLVERAMDAIERDTITKSWVIHPNFINHIVAKNESRVHYKKDIWELLIAAYSIIPKKNSFLGRYLRILLRNRYKTIHYNLRKAAKNKSENSISEISSFERELKHLQSLENKYLSQSSAWKTELIFGIDLNSAQKREFEDENDKAKSDLAIARHLAKMLLEIRTP